MVRPLEAKYKEKRDSSRLLHNAVHNQCLVMYIFSIKPNNILAVHLHFIVQKEKVINNLKKHPSSLRTHNDITADGS